MLRMGKEVIKNRLSEGRRRLVNGSDTDLPPMYKMGVVK